MSVWKDIRQKSLGQEERIEDRNNKKFQPNPDVDQLINNTQVQFAVFGGTLPDNQIKDCPGGRIYVVTNECSVNGQTFTPGQMIVQTSDNNFVVIGDTH